MPTLRTSLTVLGFALVASLAGCNRDDPAKFLESGRGYLQQKDYKAAVIELKNAIQAAPENGEARYLLASALIEVGESRDAEIELRKAADSGYNADLVQPALVRALLAMGDMDKALATATQASVTQPSAQAEMKALAGTIMLGRGQLSESRQAFSDALALDAGNAEAKLGLARLAAVADRDLPASTKLTDEVLSQSPASVDALLFKAQLLQAEGKPAEAIAALAQAVDARPHGIAANMALIPALLRAGDVKAARQRTDAFKKSARNSVAPLYMDALVLYSEGNTPGAREATQNALKHAPDYPPLLLLAGTIALQTRNLTQAEDYLSRAAKAAPNSYAQRLLVATLLQSGKPQRAKELLQPLLKARPDDPGLLSLAGEVAMGEGNYQEATKLYSKAVAADPKNVARQTRLGQAYIGSGDIDQGVHVLESAADTNAAIQADLSLIALHMNRREPEKAKDVIEGLLKKQPDNPVVHNVNGLVLQATNDETGARASFERALALQPTFFPAAASLAQFDLRDGKPQAALGRYQAILNKDPNQEQALLAMVVVMQRTGASQADVEKALDRAVNANPTSVNTNLAKINYLLGQRKYQEALTAAQKAVAVLPDSPEALEALGRAQLAAGDANQALGSFGKLISLQPGAARPLVLQSEAYAATKDWRNARAALQKALNIEPDSRPIQLALVAIDSRAGNVDAAVATARDIQKRYPKEVVGYVAEADVYAKEQRLKEVESALRAGMAKVPDVTLVARLYSLLDHQQRTKEAEALAREWMQRNPKSAELQNYIASRFSERAQWEQSAHWGREALKVAPNDPAIMNNLAWALAQMKDPSALQYGEKALANAPNSAAILDTVGWIHLQNGDTGKAVELLRKAYGFAPNSPPIRLHLAEALLRAGETKEARAHLADLAKLPEGSPVREEAQKLLGNT